ncbi:DSBA oxidoreductase [Oxalobacteraceae bacterium IMCC9480]|nr:DSBA oxidoreductase [Oxalobacteraceae bacterium IMCC9480]NDP60763.1 DsbA family oxidoreductase [Oxalobacteraceae bacterium]
MAKHLQIDFVSDVSCPWCIIGLLALEQAIARVGDEVEVTMQFQPFELNPDMPRGGQDITEHITQKYGSTPAQSAANRESIRARGEELGFTFDMKPHSRIYNTFDAHRLLHWSEEEGRQVALKHALFAEYFTDGRDPSSHEVLVDVAIKAGLDGDRAAKILATSEFADEVRAREKFFVRQGINSVPAVIINERHLIAGGQPVDVFEQALRQIIAED